VRTEKDLACLQLFLKIILYDALSVIIMTGQIENQSNADLV
jgi:hypothetical protein